MITPLHIYEYFSHNKIHCKCCINMEFITCLLLFISASCLCHSVGPASRSVVSSSLMSLGDLIQFAINLHFCIRVSAIGNSFLWLTQLKSVPLLPSPHWIGFLKTRMELPWKTVYKVLILSREIRSFFLIPVVLMARGDSRDCGGLKQEDAFLHNEKNQYNYPTIGQLSESVSIV